MLTPEDRATIFMRDGQCLLCGAKEDWTIDHILPVTLGGTDAFDNLQTLCRSCNARKGNRNTSDFRSNENLFSFVAGSGYRVKNERPNSRSFPIRLSKAERAEWREQAKREGFDDLSTWIKQLVRQRIREQKAQSSPHTILKESQEQ